MFGINNMGRIHIISGERTDDIVAAAYMSEALRAMGGNVCRPDFRKRSINDMILSRLPAVCIGHFVSGNIIPSLLEEWPKEALESGMCICIDNHTVSERYIGIDGNAVSSGGSLAYIASTRLINIMSRFCSKDVYDEINKFFCDRNGITSMLKDSMSLISAEDGILQRLNVLPYVFPPYEIFSCVLDGAKAFEKLMFDADVDKYLSAQNTRISAAVAHASYCKTSQTTKTVVIRSPLIGEPDIDNLCLSVLKAGVGGKTPVGDADCAVITVFDEDFPSVAREVVIRTLCGEARDICNALAEKAGRIKSTIAPVTVNRCSVILHGAASAACKRKKLESCIEGAIEEVNTKFKPIGRDFEAIGYISAP